MRKLFRFGAAGAAVIISFGFGAPVMAQMLGNGQFGPYPTPPPKDYERNLPTPAGGGQAASGTPSPSAGTMGNGGYQPSYGNFAPSYGSFGPGSSGYAPPGIGNFAPSSQQ